MPPWLYPTHPDDPLEPYDDDPTWEYPRWDEYLPGSTIQSVFPLQHRDFLSVMDPLHAHVMREAVFLARRFLECTKSSSPRSPKLPFVVVDERVSDGTMDDSEPDTVRIAYRHVKQLGEAFWRTMTPDATPEDQVKYKRHLFQIAVILASVMYQCKAESDDSQTEAWIWEKQLFGGWVGDDCWEPITYCNHQPSQIDTDRRYDKVTGISVRVPKAGKEGYYRINDSKIVRIVDGLNGWEEALPLVGPADEWQEGKRSLLRSAGPFKPPPKFKFPGRTYVSQRVDAEGQTHFKFERVPPAEDSDDDLDYDRICYEARCRAHDWTSF